MNINRNNYEEYFILYMDNELGSDDRRGVEEFVQRHPDLKEELEVLLQYKMTPDTSIVYSGKQELMMSHNFSSIDVNNYEEWLVMYIDDELNAEQRKDVEQFAILHPQIHEELALLQQTKLQAEQTIIFPDKELLYRRTEKVRVVYFNWRRIAVAAVLLIAVGTTALLVYNKKPAAQTDKIVSAPTKNQKTITPVVTNKENNPKVDQPVIANNVEQALVQTAKPVESKKKNVSVNRIIPVNSSLQIKKEDAVVAANNQKQSNNLPKPVNVVKENNDAYNNAIAANSNTSNIKDPLTKDLVTTATPQPSQVVYNPAVNDEDLNQSGGKKSKLRGFLRKVTRTIEKNTNINATDDDRLLVGGLSFKLK
jgi:hypothetical protein